MVLEKQINHFKRGQNRVLKRTQFQFYLTDLIRKINVILLKIFKPERKCCFLRLVSQIDFEYTFNKKTYKMHHDSVSTKSRKNHGENLI